jgi:hypothetical protein
MRRLLLPLGLLAAVSGCNCGRQVVTTAEASLSLATDELDFGAVPEGTSKGARFRLDNSGRAPVDVAFAIESGGSIDFEFGVLPRAVDASAFVDVPVIFTPTGPGSDEAVVLVTAVGSEDPPLRLTLKGGPIAPAISFSPDPLGFSPAMSAIERKVVQVKSAGTSALTVSQVGVSPSGNPDFSVVQPPQLPARLLPGEGLSVTVEYTRSARTTEGALEVLSDAADAGLARLRLLPDGLPACSNGVDDDGDQAVDFPADPGCENALDTDEANLAECVSGAMQPCQVDGGCSGTRTCVAGLWGACTCAPVDAGVDAGIDAGIDAGVDAGVDAGTGTCDPNGTFTLDAGVIAYECCNFGLGALVSIDISSFALQSSSTVLRPSPKQPGNTLTGAATSCPSGSFNYTKVISGSCTESYALTGTFVGPNTFVGTYSVTFSGADCTGSFCAGDPCTNQSWAISAGR